MFEEGIKLLLQDFPVLIFNTGLENAFGKFGIKDPKITYFNLFQHFNYDQGVTWLGDNLKALEWDIVHFIDNDLFIHDTSYIKQTIEDFANSDLGFASYFENGYGNDYNSYAFNGKTIAEVTNQQFIQKYPFMTPSWENAAMMFKRDAWNKITDYSDMNKWLPEMYEKGVRLGVKKIEPRLKYSHSGDGFIHIGKLMGYYYHIENKDGFLIDALIDHSRLGYFYYQRKRFGSRIYPTDINEFLDEIASIQGEAPYLQAWGNLVKGHYEVR